LKKRSPYKILAIVFIAIGILISLLFLLIILKQEYLNNAIFDLTKLSDFGSFIGGIVGSLWSLAGVLLIFQALTDQKEVTELNFKTYQAQVEEFKLSQESFLKQSQIHNIQNFETTFYFLLKQFFEVEQSLEIYEDDKKYVGKLFFHKLVDIFNNKIKSDFEEIIAFENESLNKKEQLIEYFEMSNYIEGFFIYNTFLSNDIYGKYKQQLNYVFKVLERILITIESANISESLKKNYLETLISQLTKEQIIILECYALTQQDEIFTETENTSLYDLSFKAGIFNLETFENLSFNLYQEYLWIDGRSNLQIGSLKFISKQIEKLINESFNQQNKDFVENNLFCRNYRNEIILKYHIEKIFIDTSTILEKLILKAVFYETIYNYCDKKIYLEKGVIDSDFFPNIIYTEDNNSSPTYEISEFKFYFDLETVANN